MKINTNIITLNYTCPNCGTKAEQDLSEIVECGTAVCGECDHDMDLDEQVDAAILCECTDCRNHQDAGRQESRLYCLSSFTALI